MINNDKQAENKIVYNNKEITLNSYNFIFGKDNDNTSLMRSISQLYGYPVFKLNNFNGVFLNDKTSYLINLKHIIEFCKIKNIPLLLDNIDWNTFDVNDQLRIIDEAFYLSMRKKVILTGSEKYVKELIKTRIYKPNIIEI